MNKITTTLAKPSPNWSQGDILVHNTTGMLFIVCVVASKWGLVNLCDGSHWGNDMFIDTLQQQYHQDMAIVKTGTEITLSVNHHD